MLLQVRGIETYYGELQVLHGVSLEVDKEQKVVILGANGAGKTTLLRSISSLIEPDYGEILFQALQGSKELLLWHFQGLLVQFHLECSSHQGQERIH